MNVPAIGFGTAPYREGKAPLDLEPAVRSALAAGFRLFDLAESYGNERAVGRALRGISRDDLTLIGKVWRTNYRPAHLRAACEASLRRLGMDRFDFYLLHAPGALRHVAPLEDAEDIGWDELLRRAGGGALTDDVPLSDTWAAMQRLVSDGLTARIGVSNFSIDEITGLGSCSANQIPCWPFEAKTVEAHRRQAITVFGYSPLRTQQRPPAVAIAWLIRRGIIPLTSSTNPQHIRENLAAAQ